MVVNFVNRKNPADQRVFQLLNDKLKLFEGVFGASDEILGAIKSNIDIEKRIYEIYQTCRTDLEIEAQFDQLQTDMEDVLSIKEEHARQSLLSHFDRDVVAALKTRRDTSQDFLSRHEQALLGLARAELPGVVVERNHFVYQDQRYDLSWPRVQANDSEFFRLQASDHYLAWELVHKAKSRVLSDAHLRFDYGAFEGGHCAALQPLIGQSGTLQLVQLTFKYAKTQAQHLLALAITDSGELLGQDNAEHLLCIPAQVQKIPIKLDTSALQPLRDRAVADKELQTEQQLEVHFEQENDKLERWAQDRRQALFLTVEALDEEIKTLKKQARQLASTAEKIQAKKDLRKLERQRDDALSEYHQAKKQIKQEEDALLDEISAKLELDTQLETLFSIRWTLIDSTQERA